MSSSHDNSLDTIVHHVTTATDLYALAHHLRTAINKDVREVILASTLSSGQDPLQILDLSNNTLGVLYILSARLNAPTNTGVPVPPWGILTQFCNTFIPEQARLAPERMYLLAKGIVRLAASIHNVKQSIPLLFAIVNRFPPTPSTLTAIHPLLVQIVLQTYHIPPELPTFLINYPPDNILLASYPEDGQSTSVAICSNPSSDLTTNDNLIYHYLAGIILALTAFSSTTSFSPAASPNTTIQSSSLHSAMDYLETVVTAPYASPMGSQNVTNVHALQLEALKKLRLLQCIALGGPQPLPKYANQTLNRMFKATPYNALVYNFPWGKPGASGSSAGSSAQPVPVEGQMQVTNPLLSQALKERELYTTECNWGLVERLARHAAPRWALKRLTETYVTLGLREIARHLSVFFEGEGSSGGVEEARALVLGMIDEGMIRATISDGGEDGGIVTFFDEYDEVDGDDAEDDVREVGHDALALKEEQLKVLLGVSEPLADPSSLATSKPAKSRRVKIQIQTLLAVVQAQSEQLAALDREFEKSKEFLVKAHKMERGGGGGGSGPMFAAGVPSGMMGEDEDLYDRLAEESMYS
ncbi:hypothetical protein D9758_005676 [Tetrapyrgos nigripes]|uniref:COP9 signalosome complex subunit 3 N-terminal helical repeats domain-containing protein n=1 Tax=Tetrapyrgos nigripes TaxID=182062 RepID=A0A8H5LQU8_9AGAR|nr:hypothetical protein D9758_005676 [Tetrapyrgos nigripes]